MEKAPGRMPGPRGAGILPAAIIHPMGFPNDWQQQALWQEVNP